MRNRKGNFVFHLVLCVCLSILFSGADVHSETEEESKEEATPEPRGKTCSECTVKKECKPHVDADKLAIKEFKAVYGKRKDLEADKSALAGLAEANYEHVNHPSKKITKTLGKILHKSKTKREIIEFVIELLSHNQHPKEAASSLGNYLFNLIKKMQKNKKELESESLYLCFDAAKALGTIVNREAAVQLVRTLKELMKKPAYFPTDLHVHVITQTGKFDYQLNIEAIIGSFSSYYSDDSIRPVIEEIMHDVAERNDIPLPEETIVPDLGDPEVEKAIGMSMWESWFEENKSLFRK